MMGDKLKQFIDENREAFDSAEPGQQLFAKLQKQLTGKRNKNPGLWRRAAVIAGPLLLAVALYFILQKKDASSNGSITDQTPAIEETTGIGDPIYAKQIYHFKELIGLKQSELKQLEKEYPQLYRQFVGDINQLDSAYQSLKINLAENPNREMLLEAMIQNLQLQSELLNRQLLIIKEIKQKSKNHEKNTI